MIIETTHQIFFTFCFLPSISRVSLSSPSSRHLYLSVPPPPTTHLSFSLYLASLSLQPVEASRWLHGPAQRRTGGLQGSMAELGETSGAPWLDSSDPKSPGRRATRRSRQPVHSVGGELSGGRWNPAAEHELEWIPCTCG
ncbi:hypothetical protein PAHAL_2G249900 [Panicum hallii]|uniref:Uncharacterized protein n=1 Tax=Panicum hallii TaxID=206008 RepID=A0A2T8KQA6_9POAL|nr:hypothetical protein PAHAL_2G249900 [Panicum hallii]